MSEPKSKDWLLLNAVECWLYYFPNHEWSDQYKELATFLRQVTQDQETQEPAPKRTTTKPTKPKE